MSVYFPRPCTYFRLLHVIIPPFSSADVISFAITCFSVSYFPRELKKKRSAPTAETLGGHDLMNNWLHSEGQKSELTKTTHTHTHECFSAGDPRRCCSQDTMIKGFGRCFFTLETRGGFLGLKLAHDTSNRGFLPEKNQWSRKWKVPVA